MTVFLPSAEHHELTVPQHVLSSAHRVIKVHPHVMKKLAGVQDATSIGAVTEVMLPDRVCCWFDTFADCIFRQEETASRLRQWLAIVSTGASIVDPAVPPSQCHQANDPTVLGSIFPNRRFT
jgi:hypothetical protein